MNKDKNNLNSGDVNIFEHDHRTIQVVDKKY